MSLHTLKDELTENILYVKRRAGSPMQFNPINRAAQKEAEDKAERIITRVTDIIRDTTLVHTVTDKQVCDFVEQARSLGFYVQVNGSSRCGIDLGLLNTLMQDALAVNCQRDLQIAKQSPEKYRDQDAARARKYYEDNMSETQRIMSMMANTPASATTPHSVVSDAALTPRTASRER